MRSNTTRLWLPSQPHATGLWHLRKTASLRQWILQEPSTRRGSGLSGQREGGNRKAHGRQRQTAHPQKPNRATREPKLQTTHPQKTKPCHPRNPNCIAETEKTQKGMHYSRELELSELTVQRCRRRWLHLSSHVRIAAGEQKASARGSWEAAGAPKATELRG